MPHDNPDLPELIRTVREFVDGISGRLDGLDRYHAMCTLYLLDIVQRELTQWQRVPGADEARLRQWLGRTADTAPDQLIAELCERIHGGAYDGNMDALHELLLAHVLDKIAISKPDAIDHPEER